MLVAVAGLSPAVFGQAFVHPGLLHTAADFTRMQANYLNQPWVGSWNILIANPRSQTTWNPRPLGTVIRGGTGQNYAQFFPDVAAAYQSALRYKITGDTAYANQSIRIMNAWSGTMTTLTGDADRFLASGIYGYEFCQAAEMMRGYSGWAASDFTRFKNLMLNVFYPLQHDFLVNHNGACIDNYWANWDLCNIAGMAAIGVLCDDRAKYNEALNYFKTGAGQGSINRSIPFIYSGSPTLGQGQEEGRDQGHSGLDVSLWGAVCQQFYNQGDDMFAYNNSRVLAACEYFAKYNINTNNTVPFTTFNWGSGQSCAANSQTVIASNSRGDQRPVWDLIYNHYQVLKGISAPNSAAYAALMRPDGGGGNYGTTSGGYDQLGYTTLTCTLPVGSPPPPPAAPTGLTASAASSNQINLSWTASSGATYYNVKHATVSGGPYTNIATGVVFTTYNDVGLSASTTNYYVVSAVNAGGESVNSAQAIQITGWSPLIWTGATNANWDINATANWSSNLVAQIYLNGSSVQFDDTTSSNLVNVAANVSPAYIVLNNSTKAYTFSSSGGFGISGTGNVVKNGGGSVAFNLVNSYSGGTIINNGTITIGYNSALGANTITLAGGTLRTTAAVVVNNNLVAQAGTASTLDTLANLTLNGSLSGSGNITRGTSGVSTVYLFGDDSGFSGTFTSVANNNSIVRFGNANAGSAAAAWVFNNSFAQRQTLESTFSSPIYFGSFSGAGDFRNNGSYNNTIQAGDLGLNDTFTGTLAANGTLSLTKAGAGTMRLTGSNPGLNGLVTVTGGELIVYPAYTGNASVVVTNDGTMGFTNQFTAVSLAISNLTLNEGSALEFQSVSNLAVPLVTASNVTLNGTCIVEIIGTNNLTVGNTYPLINYAGNFNGSFSSLQLQTPDGLSGILVSNTHQIALSVVPTPLPVTNLTATAGDSQATLNWNASANPTSYNVKRATDTNGNYGLIATIATNYYIDSGLNNGIVYYYVVSDLYSGGETANSAPVSVRPVSTVPTPLNFTAGGGQLQFNWPSDHTGWRLQVQTNPLASGLGTNWLTVPNSTNVNQFSTTISTTNGSVFFRLSYP